MTRECMDCRSVMGEKCPRCGKENLSSCMLPRDPSNEDGGELVKFFYCQNELCLHCVETGLHLKFEAGDGPNGTKNVVTTGLCSKCMSIRMGKLNGPKNSSALPLR